MMSTAMRLAACVLGVAAVLASPAWAQQDKTDVPVKRVVYFSSGVGYFEHVGSVTDDAVAQLQFKTEQMNDVLKSMVVMDTGEGGSTSVRYPSRDPLVHALKSFAIDLSGNPKLADLLTQVRGAAVQVKAPEMITGKILNVEIVQKQTPGPNPLIIPETFLNLVTPMGIKSIPMDSVQSITLADARLQEELNKALEVLMASHDTDRKPVEIRFAGKGKRDVRIGYIVQAPVWKTSYRLELSGEKPLLQGWAIVENTSDNDWNGVTLSLITGQPISFIQDLYTPLYIDRPVVQPELFAGLRPQLYEEGLAMDAKRAEKAEAGREQLRRSAPMADRALAAAPPAAARYKADDARGDIELKQLAPMAAGGKVGELFHFTLKDPVTLPRRRSAMLPIINAPIQAQKLSIYNQSVQNRHPLNGAWVTNSTDMKLPAGPVTVLDDSIYAGDARLDNMTQGEKRLISYAIDLQVTVDPSQSSSQRIASIKIVRGVLEISRLQQFQQTYKIHNKAAAKKTVMIEHPFVAQRQLIQPEKAEEKTPQLYRFLTEVEAGKTADFLVKEQQVFSQTLEILPMNTDTLLGTMREGEMPAAVKEALGRAVEMKNALSQLQSRQQQLRQQVAQIKSDHERLRQNLASVGPQSALGKKYIDKLSKDEEQIEQLEGQIQELQKQIDEQNRKLADYVRELSVQ